MHASLRRLARLSAMHPGWQQPKPQPFSTCWPRAVNLRNAPQVPCTGLSSPRVSPEASSKVRVSCAKQIVERLHWACPAAADPHGQLLPADAARRCWPGPAAALTQTPPAAQTTRPGCGLLPLHDTQLIALMAISCHDGDIKVSSF